MAIALAGAIISIALLISFTTPQKSVDMPMDVLTSQGKVIGFNVGTDAVHFGKVPLNAESDRKIIITSSKSRRMKVDVTMQGDIANWVTAEPSEFNMEPNETSEVLLTVHVPGDATPNINYTGTVKVTYKSVSFLNF